MGFLKSRSYNICGLIVAMLILLFVCRVFLSYYAVRTFNPFPHRAVVLIQNIATDEMLHKPSANSVGVTIKMNRDNDRPTTGYKDINDTTDVVYNYYTDVSTSTTTKVPLQNETLQIENLVEETHGKYRIVLYSIVQQRIQLYAEQLNMSRCQKSNCEVLLLPHQTSEPVDANAIVFQGNRLPEIRPGRKSSDQAFVYMNNEPPAFMHDEDSRRLSSEERYFNWTMTYRRDSDIWSPYGHVFSANINKRAYLQSVEQGKHPRTVKTDIVSGIAGKNYTQIYRNKTKTALWLVGHCQSNSEREALVDEMGKFADIKIFGKCAKKRVAPVHEDDTWPDQYKFFFAFENSYCRDYVTEKVFEWFQRDMILVVRGGANYSEILPPNTYINADDFATGRDLAMYLNKLGSNEDEYMGYLRRKDGYQVVKEQESVLAAFCGLCWRLNDLHTYRGSVQNVTEWWFDACQ